MDIRNIIIRANWPRLHSVFNHTKDLDIKKIATIALKILIIGYFFHHKKDAFSMSFTAGILTGFITKRTSKFDEFNRFIDENPIRFLRAAAMTHVILYPADLELGAIASGLYSGVGIAKLCK